MNYFGMIDMSLVYLNEYYMTSAIVGGIIMGAGFIIGGFCPGTSVCAAAIGKIDAMYFIGGGLIGIFIFGETYPLWEKLYNAQYLGTPKLSDNLGMKDGVLGLIVIAAATAMFWIGEMAEKRFKREDISKEL
jgi:uncharacterized protein